MERRGNSDEDFKKEMGSNLPKARFEHIINAHKKENRRNNKILFKGNKNDKE